MEVEIMRKKQNVDEDPQDEMHSIHPTQFNLSQKTMESE